MSKWWEDRASETPQKRGRRLEGPMAKSYDARLHPNSGAGKIKNDASNTEQMFEFKTTDKKGYRLTTDELLKLFTSATQVDKEPVFVIDFVEHGIRAEIRPTRI